MGTFVLKPGEKYGLIIFPDVSVAVDLPKNSQVASDLWVAQIRGTQYLIFQNGSHMQYS